MRARSIKPGICDNEILGTADPFYTLLFERLWMMADRAGRLEDRPLRIKAQAFPYRDGLDVNPMLDWLHEHNFIVRYEASGNKYIQVCKFLEHQKPHQNEKESVIPEQASTTKVASEHNQGRKHLALNPSSLTPDSGLLTPDSGSLDVAPPATKGKPTPEGEMAVALRDLGVEVTSQHQTLCAWIRDGFTLQKALDATALARMRKPWPEKIPANYLDKILREPPRADPIRKTKFDRAMEELNRA